MKQLILPFLILLGDLAACDTPVEQNRAQENVNVTIPSNHDFETTTARLEAGIESRDLNLIATVDHAAGAQQAGLALLPTRLYIFGNPAVGTLVIKANRRAGLDLPLKALIWRDENGAVFITFRQPRSLVDQWRLDPAPAEAIGKMSQGLKDLVIEVAGRAHPEGTRP